MQLSIHWATLVFYEKIFKNLIKQCVWALAGQIGVVINRKQVTH